MTWFARLIGIVNGIPGAVKKYFIAPEVNVHQVGCSACGQVLDVAAWKITQRNIVFAIIVGGRPVAGIHLLMRFLQKFYLL